MVNIYLAFKLRSRGRAQLQFGYTIHIPCENYRSALEFQTSQMENGMQINHTN